MSTTEHYNEFGSKSTKLLVAAILVLLFIAPATYAQNTKGDRPETGPSKRETRFKSSSRKKIKKKQSANRVQPRRSVSGRASSSAPQKIYSQKNRFVNNASRTSKVQKQNLRQSSKRVVAKSSSSQTRRVYPQSGPFVNNPSPTPSSKPPKIKSNASAKRLVAKSRPITNNNVYRQRGPFVNNPSRVPDDKPRLTKNYSRGYRPVKSPPKDSQQRWKAVSSKRVTVRSASGRTKNVFPQKGPFVNNPSPRPRQTPSAVSNKSQLSRLKKAGSPPQPPGKKRVTVRSTSRPYISGKSINAFAGFWNKKPKGEKPYTRGDLAGKPLRKKNFETTFPTRINPTANPYKPKKSVGDRPYKGPDRGGYKSATSTGKAWSGDIAGRKIRGRNKSSKTVEVGRAVFPRKQGKQRIGDRPYRGTIPGGGYRSSTKTGITGKPFFTTKRSKQKVGDTPYRGTIPGGGYQSVSGKTKRGGRLVGKTFEVRGAQFAGTQKAKKPLKGGGSISGGLWNNDGTPLMGTPPLRRNIGYALFAGNKKTRVAPKGGGSVSGKINTNKPLVGKAPSDSQLSAGSFQGRLKSQKPLKGGGSVSGRLWNNNNRPLTGRSPSSSQLSAGAYQGTLKVSKKAPSKEIGGYGKLKDYRPAMRDQGEEFTGFIKVKKKSPSKEVGGFPGKMKDTRPPFQDQGEEFTGYIRLPRFPRYYTQNPNASKEAIKKARENKHTFYVNNLHIKVKQQQYGKKPNAAEGALKGITVSKSSIKASEYSKVIRQQNYVRNPSSAEEALKTKEPGKAFARATDYQGNIKMKKFELFGKKELHPDATFVKINKNNTPEEKDALTNFKLWWARLFKKNDTQPDHLKEKVRKPRYDKGEQGLWYD